MKRRSPLPSILILTLASLALVGCGQSTGSVTGPASASPSTSPAQVSSSADVVKISSTAVFVNAGQSTDAMITLAIRSGFHVNANPPTFAYLIPTEVTPAKVEGITAGKPLYPAPVKRKFQFADQPLAVYEGDALLRLPINVAAGAPKGLHSLPITLRVQACDEEQCFPPATLNATIQIEVK